MPLHLLAQAASQSDPRTAQVNSALWLFVAFLAFVVGAMLTLLAVISWRRIRRIRRMREAAAVRAAAAAPPSPDPWQESARRLAASAADADAPAEPDLGSAQTASADTGRHRLRRGSSTPANDPSAAPIADLEALGSTGHPIVMITGGARRVGRAIAESFAVAGCDVLLTFNSSREEAEIAAAELQAHGVLAAITHADFDDDAAADLFARRIASSLPRLDALIHNASIYSPSPLDELDAGTILRNYRVNAMSPLLLTARLSRLLANSGLAGGGSVVAMCDMHAMGRPRKDFAAYAMSKAALIEMVRSLARDMAPLVRVNGVAPGVVAWPDQGYESDESEQAKYIRRIPLGRSGTPEEAADVVRWLALEASYITGEVIRIDGGRWLT